ncbi:MAG: hypothetical protein JY451_09180 [Erythrobacter sp.]|nr:MAG: hypothetical protein JY451_09180 [Erythrobacter sp.]
MKITQSALACAALLLAACDSSSAERSGETVPPPPAQSEATPADVPMTSPVAQSAIPAAMAGRWGMTPADCDPEEAANKGLLTVSGNSMRFYESVGELEEVAASTTDSLRGNFAYEGEGMAWSREVTLALADDGNTLILEEFGDDAVPGARRYTKCG